MVKSLTEEEWYMYEERAAIMEFDSGLSRKVAEKRAMEEIMRRREDGES